MRSPHSPHGTECGEHEKLAWPLPLHEEMQNSSRVLERAPPAVDGGWEVNYEFFLAHIHLVCSEREESGKLIAEISRFSSNFGV